MRFLFLSVILLIFYGCKSDSSKINIQKHAWKTVKAPVKGNAMQSYLFASNDKLLMSWTQRLNDSLSSLNYAEFMNNNWSEPQEITKGYDWFVNWADFPAIAENNNELLTHYLPKSDEATFAYDVYLKLFNKQSNTWKEAIKLHSDTTKTEHGFVSMMPYKQNSFFVSWLDGRNTSGGHSHGGAGAMTVRAAEILFDGTKKQEVQLDAKVCDCCQTSVAITQNGPIVVYRDRSDEEIRDIAISRFIDGDWTLPKAIHNDGWKIKGCPVNGPKAVALNNQLAIAWFTGANNTAKVNVVFSNDNGKTFAKPFQIDNGASIGRVDAYFLDADNLLVSWMESTDTGAEIRVAKINSTKGKVLETVVSKLSAARASGFPQLEIFNNEVFVAFNSVNNEASTITIRKIPTLFFLE